MLPRQFLNETRTVRSIEDFCREGTSARSVHAATLNGDLLRVRRGFYTDADEWKRAFPEQRIRLAAQALVNTHRAPIVFAYHSAAAIWGLPLYRTRADRVHVVQFDAGAPTTRTVFRHRDEIEPNDIVWLKDADVGVMSLARTAVDLACVLSWEAAQAVMDAAWRAAALIPDSPLLDSARSAQFAAQVEQVLAAKIGRRGIRQARLVSAFADPRADLPGESVSRLYLSWLGFSAPDLQVPVRGPHGYDYYVDFGFPGWWGEFDGTAKYVDPGMTRGRSPEDVLNAQYARETWISQVTGKPFARWQMADIASPTTLRARLLEFGITPPHPQ